MQCARWVPILLSIAWFAPPASADSAAGKKLYDANCTGCHTTSVHTRADHKMTSLDALDKQLIACAQAAKVTLSDAQRNDIAQYLNEQFYKFK